MLVPPMLPTTPASRGPMAVPPMVAPCSRLVARTSGTSPARCGMAAVRPGCSTLSATPKQRTSRIVAVREWARERPHSAAATTRPAPASRRPIGRRSSRSPDTGASRTTGRPPASRTMVTAQRRVGLLVHAQRQGDVGQAVPGRHHHLERRGDPQGPSRRGVAWKCGSAFVSLSSGVRGVGRECGAAARVRALVVAACAGVAKGRERRKGISRPERSAESSPGATGARELSESGTQSNMGSRIHGGLQPDSRRRNSGRGGMARRASVRPDEAGHRLRPRQALQRDLTAGRRR